LDILFSDGTSCEIAASLAEKNAAAWHHVLRSLKSLHDEHRVSFGKYEYYANELMIISVLHL
jgi:hypothetical protein